MSVPTAQTAFGEEVQAVPGGGDLLVVSLGGNGQYEHVINDVGSPTSGPDTIPSQVVNFP
ncbi:hypothetical protein MQC87_23995 [Streptomyces sp. TRM75563]|nr:hypothetical protein [Streptomyces sp. TRM75563]MCI4044166.1 hypothetical protein [Streptomyces sp. TRM75563]